MFFQKSDDEIKLFPVVLKKYKYPNHKILKEFLKSYLHNARDQKKNDFDGVKTYFQPNDKDSDIESFFDCESKIILDFKKFCEDSATDYVSNVLEEQNSEMFCSNAWVNYYYLDRAQQCPHHHMNAYVCGNYYLNFDSDNHTNLEFVNPKINNVFNTIPFNAIFSNLKKSDVTFLKDYNRSSQPVECKEGEFIIWPSWLVHQVPPSNKGRKTISMNFMPKVIRTVNYGFRVEKL